MIRKFQTQQPTIEGWVADSAEVIGNVHIKEHASVWFQTVIRGDNDAIIIGEGSNVQDGSILHTDAGHQLRIGKHVTIGHGCILHGCTIEDHVMIGMGSIIMNGAHIGKNCIIGAGSLISEGKVIPDNSIAFGSPARIQNAVTKQQIEIIEENAKHYIALTASYKEGS